MMSVLPIDHTTLSKALSRLREAITLWHGLDAADPLKPHLRSAVIQSFEFTYELAIRSTRRVLIERASSADMVRDLSFNDLLRRALDAGLPMPLDAWRRWLDMRNGTSHTYDEERALVVALAASDFVDDVAALLVRLDCDPPP